MLNRILNHRTNTVTLAAVILVFSALASRILGLVRDRLLAGRFGAGEELDIYFAAFRIPDFIYGILIMGGISAVFLPVFSEMRKRNAQEGWHFVNNTLNIIFVALVFLCATLALATPYLIHLIVPGFSPSHKDLAIALTRIMFLSPILLGLSSIFSGLLQYFHRFLVYSFAPVFYNLGIILGIIFFVPPFGLQGLAYGVILGAALHLVIQIPTAFSTGWKYAPFFSLRHSGMKKLFRLTVPRVLGTSAYHINLVVITAIGSTLGAGAIAVFNFSNNLQYLPIGLIGVSFATAAFPSLAKSWAEGNKKRFWNQFSSAFRQTLFFITPISVLIILLRAHIVRIVLGTGAFGWEDTRLVAASLGLFAISIFAAALIPLLARALFSLQDTKTPAFIALAATIFNIALALFLVRNLDSLGILRNFFGGFLRINDIQNIAVVGLPLAISLSTIAQFLGLAAALHRKLDKMPLGEILSSLSKMLIAGLGLGIVTYTALQAGPALFDIRTFWGIFLQTAIAGVAGSTAYIGIAFILRSPEVKTLFIILRAKRFFRSKIEGETFIP